MSAKVVHRSGIAVSAVALFALTGCLEREKFPDEPILIFKTVEQGYEVPYMGTTPERYLNVVVDFTDGDGDIGLDAGDTLDPFGVNDAHYFNCMCVLEKRIEGEWAGVQSEVPGRIKRISPSGQDPTLNGEIKWKLWPYPGPRPGLPPIVAGDTMRVTMYLEDRALHRSNSVMSGAFVLQ